MVRDVNLKTFRYIFLSFIIYNALFLYFIQFRIKKNLKKIFLWNMIFIEN